MIGGIQADQSISFQLMEQKLTQFVDIIRQDPAVENVVGFTGGGQTNSGFVFVVLKPLSERKVSVMQVIGRLRGKLNQVAGARLFLQAVQDISGRRPPEQRPVPVHAAGRRRQRDLRVGAQGRGGAAKDRRC